MPDKARRLSDRPLVYVGDRPDTAFWTEHWSRQDLHRLVEEAGRSRVTAFIERHVRPGDRMLEAGCGLGQYVVYFARRGRQAVGVDSSQAAIERHRLAFPDSEVQVADLRALSFDDGVFDAYVSLGVIEHYEEGPAAMLREARRVLKPGGVAIISTPYLNVIRRLLRDRIEARQDARAAAGATFYQYAFSARMLDSILDEAGFAVRKRAYYGLSRGARELAALLRATTSRSREAASGLPRRSSRLRRVVADVPLLPHVLAHMQIVAAVRR